MLPDNSTKAVCLGLPMSNKEQRGKGTMGGPIFPFLSMSSSSANIGKNSLSKVWYIFLVTVFHSIPFFLCSRQALAQMTSTASLGCQCLDLRRGRLPMLILYLTLSFAELSLVMGPWTSVLMGHCGYHLPMGQGITQISSAHVHASTSHRTHLQSTSSKIKY